MKKPTLHTLYFVNNNFRYPETTFAGKDWVQQCLPLWSGPSTTIPGASGTACFHLLSRGTKMCVFTEQTSALLLSVTWGRGSKMLPDALMPPFSWVTVWSQVLGHCLKALSVATTLGFPGFSLSAPLSCASPPTTPDFLASWTFCFWTSSYFPLVLVSFSITYGWQEALKNLIRLCLS